MSAPPVSSAQATATRTQRVKRQAVVIIHGIGEQKPMGTLRGFVETVWKDHKAIHHRYATPNAGELVWSKPDTVSDSFELRRLTTPQNSAQIRTDFFEFYWQHLMEGTTFGHVRAWAGSLLLRKPSTVPSQLKPLYWLLWLTLVVAGVFAIHAALGAATDEELFHPLLSLAISIVIVPAAAWVALSIVGDAARYLHVAPANVQCRNEIRLEGVKLLHALHQPERKYDRIVLVGHSLGSVIGYDILTHAWPTYNREVGASAPATSPARSALEGLAVTPAATVDQIQRAQRDYFEELVAAGNPWRVTDFVTLGSPLAHAELLLAKDRAELRTRQGDREFPTCLPTLETVIQGGQQIQRFSYQVGDGPQPKYMVPHHAAVFGPTRWTNLYFPNSLLFRGDLVGGPLREVHGTGIRDVSVTTSERGGWFSHTLYWRQPRSTQGAPHIAALRDAIDLVDGKP